MKKLPNLKDSLPVYTLTLPVSQKEITYTPYTNREVKSILIASQEKDYKTLITTLESIVETCCGFVPDNITDFSYIITHINAKSNGENLEYILKKCECGHQKVPVKIDNVLDVILIKNQDKTKSIFKLTDNISLRLSPTKIDYFKNLTLEETPDNILKQIDMLIFYSIDYVLSGKDIIKDFSYEEYYESIGQHLTPNQKRKINEEIGNLVRFCLVVKYICPGCKKEFEKEINDFLFLS